MNPLAKMNPLGKLNSVTNGQGDLQGVLLRGQDGKLYFIPDSKLAPFAVPEKGQQQMGSKIASDQPATHTTVPSEWVNVGLSIIQQG